MKPPLALVEIATIVRGVSFGSDDSISTPQPGYVPILRAGNIQQELILDHDLAWVPGKFVGAEQLLRRNDIVMCTSSGSINVLGKSGIVEEQWSGSFGAFCVTVRANDLICNPRYLFHFLRSDLFRAWTRRSSGANIKNIRKSELESFKITLPSLPEQRRIATILDKADAIRRKRRQAIDLMNDFLRSVFLEMFGDPDANPHHYPEPELRELLEAIDSGKSPVCLSRKAEAEEWGVLKLSAVTGCNYRSDENKALPPEEIPNPLNEVQTGDILFARKNTYELVGDCAFVWNTRPKLLLPDLIFRLKLRHDAPIIPLYLWGLLTSPTMRNRIQKLAGGTAGSMPNISKSRLEGLRIPLPSLEIQKQFATILQKANNTKMQLAESVSKSNELFTSVSNQLMGGSN